MAPWTAALAVAMRRRVRLGWKLATGMRMGMQEAQPGQTGA